MHWHDEVDGPGFWAITRYADIRAISRQPKLFSSAARGVMLAESDEMGLMIQRQMMLVMDPPEHDRFKLLVSRGFTPKRAELLRDRIRQLAREIVDDVIERGECDLVHDVAGRLPSGPDRGTDGHPREDGERLYELTELMHTTDDTVATPEQRGAATLEMLSYAAETAARKRAEPGDDIASGLVQAEVDGQGLTDGELQWFFLLLVNAGGDTTRNLLASGIQLLFDHPDQRARLEADLDGLLGTTVEEMLRYTTPVVNFRRTAMEDTMVGDQPIAAGDKLMVFYGSGNRDAEVFADPDRVRRRPGSQPAHGLRRWRPAPLSRPARGADRDRRDAARVAHPPAGPRTSGPTRGVGVELHQRRPNDAGVVHPRFTGSADQCVVRDPFFGVSHQLAPLAEVFEVGVGLALGHLTPRPLLEQHAHELLDRPVRQGRECARE